MTSLRRNNPGTIQTTKKKGRTAKEEHVEVKVRMAVSKRAGQS